MTPPPSVVVCLPTFRRPAMLGRTLASLAAQRTSRDFRVVVVDNDARSRDGMAAAKDVLAEGRLRGLAVLEPRQGNCHAINTALATARDAFPSAAHILMIDDDEVASPDWLDRMVSAAERHGVDIVGGPVFPAFAPGTRASAARHPVFFPAFSRSGAVPRIYGSGNFLIRRDAFARLVEPGFHDSFNFLGGGDTDFFRRCEAAGLRFHWEHEASAIEEVPPDRTRPGWIVRRCLRIGAINLRVERRQASTRAAMIAIHLKSAAALPFGLLRGGLTLARTGSPLLASYRPLVALGRILAGFGLEPQQYRAPPVAEAPAGAEAGRAPAAGSR